MSDLEQPSYIKPNTIFGLQTNYRRLDPPAPGTSASDGDVPTIADGMRARGYCPFNVSDNPLERIQQAIFYSYENGMMGFEKWAIKRFGAMVFGTTFIIDASYVLPRLREKFLKQAQNVVFKSRIRAHTHAMEFGLYAIGRQCFPVAFKYTAITTAALLSIFSITLYRDKFSLWAPIVSSGLVNGCRGLLLGPKGMALRFTYGIILGSIFNCFAFLPFMLYFGESADKVYRRIRLDFYEFHWHRMEHSLAAARLYDDLSHAGQSPVLGGRYGALVRYGLQYNEQVDDEVEE